MFGVSSPRRGYSVLVLGLLALTILGLAGCGEKEEVDPYVYDSVRRIMEGDTLSIGFLFEIDAPEFEYVRGNTGMIRNGNLLNFLIYEDIENNYKNLSGTLLGVVKTFSPQPTHMVVQRIKRNGVVEVDSIPRPSSYIMPRLLRAGAIDLETPGAPLPEIGWKTKDLKEARATFLPEEEEEDLRPIQTGIETFVYQARHDLADSVKMNPSAEDYAWYAVFPEASIQITDLSPGAEWMMHLLLDQDLPLIGSFSLKTLEDEYRLRKIEHEVLGHVIGTMKINWFKFGNTFVEGSAAE
ncbi:MAG: hypothetical protein KOO60_06745 [Gemmatimonadales bacterium]|nr:hypothetical protein [Gemmatimonadales bacterium]